MAKAPQFRRKNSHNATKEIAAAVATAGAVAVGGKLAKDRISGKRAQKREYRLHREESPPDGIRRIARGQVDNSAELLAKASGREIGEAVHETRKSLKRLRALVKISRPALGDARYRRENAEFRQTGRLLSAARDAKVLTETLDGLFERAGDELSPDTAAPLRSRLEEEHARALEALVQDEAAVETVLARLKSARRRTARWTFPVQEFDVLTPGLERIYRRARRRFRAAAAQPSDENLHEWRKRVKDFWHACQIVRLAAPKRLKRLGKRAHQLSDLLGEDHDLVVLRAYVETHPGSLPDVEARESLQVLIERRRQVLQQQAFEIGAELFKQGPRPFAGGLERGWKKRVPETPRPAIA
jgi:CHAD domain-containing protein